MRDQFSGSITCRFGHIISERPITQECEWRNFDSAPSERARASTAYDKSGGEQKFSADIVETIVGSDGTVRTRSTRTSLNQSPMEKQLFEIKRVSGLLIKKFNVPENILAMIIDIYNQICRANADGSTTSFRGKSIIRLSTVLFYKACQLSSIPIEQKIFVDKVNELQIEMTSKEFNKELKFIEGKIRKYKEIHMAREKEMMERNGLEYDPKDSLLNKYSITAAKADEGLNHGRIKKICDQMKINTKLRDTIMKFFDYVNSTGCAGGSNVNTVIGACLYICCGLPDCVCSRSIVSISEKVGITQDTIMRCYRLILESRSVGDYMSKEDFKKTIYG